MCVEVKTKHALHVFKRIKLQLDARVQGVYETRAVRVADTEHPLQHPGDGDELREQQEAGDISRDATDADAKSDRNRSAHVARRGGGVAERDATGAEEVGQVRARVAAAGAVDHRDEVAHVDDEGRRHRTPH